MGGRVGVDKNRNVPLCLSIILELGSGPIFTMLEKFESAALFLLLGPQSVLILRKCPLKMELFKTALQAVGKYAGFAFWCGRIIIRSTL